MPQLILFNKPYGILSQFSGDKPENTLAAFINTSNVYPAGRLDKDSEGLLLLTDCGNLQHRISHPSRKLLKTYWVQVEGEVDEVALSTLRSGIRLNDGLTAPARVIKIPEPELWQRVPPIRKRLLIPTSWIEISISEGRNRQIRRMTAAVGYPTLRLVRAQIGQWKLKKLQPGDQELILL